MIPTLRSINIAIALYFTIPTLRKYHIKWPRREVDDGLAVLDVFTIRYRYITHFFVYFRLPAKFTQEAFLVIEAT